MMRVKGNPSDLGSDRTAGLALSNTVAISILLVFVVLGAGIAAAMLFSPKTNVTNSSSSTSQTVSQANVTIFGLVSTSGTGTHPTSVVFISFRSGQIFVAPMTGNKFSIGLPNQDTYNVSLRWAGNYSWQNVEVQRGALTINMSFGSMMAQSYNVVETTPNSMVTVTGTLFWQVISSNPASIRFTATNGQQFISDVFSNKTFSISLPNMMTYEIGIGTQNATGNTEWYYAHHLEVNVGANVIGLTVNVSM
jgi:hypothetical protein